tara:strand:+ start:295 stop:1560 length:1266 start_codon:yes stop_codon:yes gene_type:complete
MDIDDSLLKFTKSDVFTPDKISKIMSSYLLKEGNLLEPAVGEGHLLKFLDLKDYDTIDIYDIKQDYLDKCPENSNINKHKLDFIRENISKKYKNIIFNPPFIRIQDLSPEYRTFLKGKWDILTKGNLDIYYAFILKCLDLLTDDGVMVSITPNSYLYNKSSLKLREFLIQNRYIDRIIDFKSEKVFPSVATYCCITVYSKKDKNSFIYNDKTIRYEDIVNDEYNIFVNPENKNSIKLEDICSIKNGIATLRDKIYIHKEKKFDEPCWKQLISGDKDIWCIFPYSSDAAVLDEYEFKRDNPETYEYLLSNKEELAKRDKGNKTYPKWYSYGRTQSLKISTKENILYAPTFSDPENISYRIDKPKLCSGCLSIEVIDDRFTLEQVKQALKKNKDFIVQNSSKRGGGWINISSRILKQVPINLE